MNYLVKYYRNAECGTANNKYYTEEIVMENSNDKVYGVLSYLGILWLVGLLASKSEYTKFHVNQGIVLFIIEVAAGILSVIIGFIPFVGWILSGIIGGVVGLACFVLAILGIVNAAQGEMKALPVIGSIKILK